MKLCRQFSVTTAAQKAISANQDRISYEITTPSSGTVTAGDSGSLTTTNGEPLPAGARVDYHEASGQDVKSELWLIGSGSLTVGIREDFARTR
jgi:hypothetical protein